MPYRSKKRQRLYAARWRKTHPEYMRNYYQNFYKGLGKKRAPKVMVVT